MRYWIVGGALAVVGIAAVGIAVAANSRYFHWYIVDPIRASQAMRWYRCIGVDHPLLAEPAAEWTLNYSWSDGLGPGNVAVEIRSDGHARMQAWSLGETVSRRAAALSPSQVRAIATLVDESGLLCQIPKAHPELTVLDLGTYVVSVRSREHVRTVFVDECHNLDDGAALSDVQRGIAELSTVLGDELDWRPAGYVGLDDPCVPRTPRVLVPERG